MYFIVRLDTKTDKRYAMNFVLKILPKRTSEGIDDPLGTSPLYALVRFVPLISPSFEGNVVVHLYDTLGTHIGPANIVWTSLLEHIDPALGHYMIADAYIDDINLEREMDDEECKDLIVSTFKDMGFAVCQFEKYFDSRQELIKLNWFEK